MTKRMVFILPAILLTACSFAPKYQRPEMPIPAQYKETKIWKAASPVGRQERCERWWLAFNDDVLNGLQERLTVTNQNLQISLARFQEARALLQVSRSALYPEIFALGSADRQKTSTTVANPPTKSLYNNFLTGTDLSYEVDLWGRVRNVIAASEHATTASADDLAGVALTLHAELASNYFSLRGSEAAQAVLDKTVVAYQKALHLTKKRHSGGVSPIADVDQAITQLENAKVLAEDMHLKRAQFEHAIAILVGDLPVNFQMPVARAKINFISITPELPSSLLERRPDIAAAEQRVIAANAQIGVARAAFFPAFNLSSIIGFQSKTLANIISKPSLFWSLGPVNVLNLTQPMIGLVLFDGGNLHGQLNHAKASYFETVAQYRQTVLTAFRDVEDNLVAIRQLDKENISQTRATLSAMRALKQAKNRYVGGIITYLDVVVNENIALQAELASIDIKTRRQLASVQLIKALGGGWQS